MSSAQAPPATKSMTTAMTAIMVLCADHCGFVVPRQRPTQPSEMYPNHCQLHLLDLPESLCGRQLLGLEKVRGLVTEAAVRLRAGTTKTMMAMKVMAMKATMATSPNSAVAVPPLPPSLVLTLLSLMTMVMLSLLLLLLLLLVVLLLVVLLLVVPGSSNWLHWAALESGG
jgi:hypothetical protein